MLPEYCRVSGGCSAGIAQELFRLMALSPDITVSLQFSLAQLQAGVAAVATLCLCGGYRTPCLHTSLPPHAN